MISGLEEEDYPNNDKWVQHPVDAIKKARNAVVTAKSRTRIEHSLNRQSSRSEENIEIGDSVEMGDFRTIRE